MFVEPVFPLAGQARRGQRTRGQQLDHVETLFGDDQRPRVTLDVADLQEPLDDRGASRRRADPGLLHRLAQLLVVDELAGRLHRAQQRSVGVTTWRLGLLRLERDPVDLRLFAPLERRQLLLGSFVIILGAGRSDVGAGALAVDAAPSGHEQHLAARAEDVLGNGGLDAGILEHRLGVEHRQETPDDEVVDAAVVLVHLLDRVTFGERRDDRVVVGHLLVVDHPPERQHVQPGHVGGGARVLALAADQLGDRLDLADHVGGDVPRVGARVGEGLVLLVEPLGGAKRATRREPEAGRCLALQRGQVVEQRRAVLALGLVELGDGTDLALAGGDDRARLGLGRDPRIRAGVKTAVVGSARSLRAAPESVRRRPNRAQA